MAWVNWLVWYRTQTIAPASANTMRIDDIYQTWIQGVVQNFQGTLESSISDLQQWWEDLAKLPANAPQGMSKRDVPVDVRCPHSNVLPTLKPISWFRSLWPTTSRLAQARPQQTSKLR